MNGARIALLFSGQGAQYPAMLEDIMPWRNTEAIVARAGVILGADLRACVRMPAYLATTLGAQLSTVVAGIAAAEALAAQNVVVEFVAGQSVGVYAAAVVAGALSLEVALALAEERATRMMQAFPGGYGLAAIVGLAERTVQAIVDEAHDASLGIANYNAPGQYVLAGGIGSLEHAIAAALRRGARRATILDVAVPSHSALLEDVAGAFRPALEAAPIADPRITMIGATEARVLRNAADVRAELIGELHRPQHWHDATEALRERGASLFVQCGPGDALADLATTAFPDARAVALASVGPEGIAALCASSR